MPYLPRRLLLALAALAALSACAREDLTAAPEPLGNFLLGHVVIVADQAEKVGPSRDAQPDEWTKALTREIKLRTGRYSGDKYYHLGIKVEAYALAHPGIPVVLAPKSILAISVNVWDDSAQRRINAEPRQLTVFEPFTASTVIGSGLVQTREQQIDTLSANAARKINDWLVENKAWFTPEAAAARALLPATPPSAAVPAATAAAKPAATAPKPAPAATPAPATTQAPAASPAPASPAQARSTARNTGSNSGPGIDMTIRNSITAIPGATLP